MTGSAPRALLVGYEDRDTLGVRDLVAALAEAGFQAEIMRFDPDPLPLVRRVLAERPALVGFSLIFQYMAPDFGRLVSALREAGCQAHLTMGGHYASFEPEQILLQIPGLDSVVRFEGEHTLVALMRRLRDQQPWRDVDGIAWREGSEVHRTAARAPVTDLDTLPWPDRGSFDYEHEELPAAAILGSRGCPWRCSFCSIRPFYEAQGGALRRFRRPEAVAAEMAALHRDRGVRVFLFQDDDFLGGGRRARAWAVDLADALHAVGLPGQAAFKVSCRSDEVHEETMARLVDAGLTHVYMGVEAGDPDDLRDMNKLLMPDRHIQAGEVLRGLGISFDFGFMLMQPYSTVERVRNNLDFLERFVGDGYSVLGFCRMLPYAGTPIRDRLLAEGRLLGTDFEPDYRFGDPRLDLYYDWLLRTFHERNFTTRGLSHILRALNFEARLRLTPARYTSGERDALQHWTAVAIYTLRRGLERIVAMDPRALDPQDRVLALLTAHERREEERIVEAVLRVVQRAVARRPDPDALSGGFGRAWTHAEVAAAN